MRWKKTEKNPSIRVQIKADKEHVKKEIEQEIIGSDSQKEDLEVPGRSGDSREALDDVKEILEEKRKARENGDAGKKNQKAAGKYGRGSQKDWREYYKDKESSMKKMITDVAESFQQDPGKLSEILEFASQFYQYSYRNTLLIHQQNKGATFVQSFDKWKEAGVSIKKGQHGMNIWVPVRTTILHTGEKEWVQLRYATKEQKEAFKKGEIESREIQSFRIGTVFDISQTNFPKERYPEFYHMGYADKEKGTIAEGLRNYCVQELRCPVYDTDLNSISLRGLFFPQGNRIELNEDLEDTERLSTLSHEIGHALLHKAGGRREGMTAAQKEFEADALSLMVSSHFGVEITEGRKNHLNDHYRRFREEAENGTGKDGEDLANESIEKSLTEVFSVFKKQIESMDRYVNLALEQNLPYQKKASDAMREVMRRAAARYPARMAQKGMER